MRQIATLQKQSHPDTTTHTSQESEICTAEALQGGGWRWAAPAALRMPSGAQAAAETSQEHCQQSRLIPACQEPDLVAHRDGIAHAKVGMSIAYMLLKGSSSHVPGATQHHDVCRGLSQAYTIMTPTPFRVSVPGGSGIATQMKECLVSKFGRVGSNLMMHSRGLWFLLNGPIAVVILNLRHSPIHCGGWCVPATSSFISSPPQSPSMHVQPEHAQHSQAMCMCIAGRMHIWHMLSTLLSQ